MLFINSAGVARYHNNRCEVVSDNSFAACWLNGLAVATRIALLMRSNGSTHQRRQISAGKPRVNSMSISYLSSGKNGARDLSASSLSDFST